MTQTPSAAIHGRLDEGLHRLGIAVDGRQHERLLALLALLHKWNRAYNLTAIRSPDEMVAKHLLDSAAVAPFVTAEALLDVGAGPGLPGLVLAILEPERPVTLLDSNGKKTRFLNQCVLELGLKNVEVVHGRAEDCNPPEPFSQISSRAFTALENLVSWCGDLLANEGEFLAMKGQFPDDEVAALPAGWQVKSSHSLDVPGADGERHLLVVARAAKSR